MNSREKNTFRRAWKRFLKTHGRGRLDRSGFLFLRGEWAQEGSPMPVDLWLIQFFTYDPWYGYRLFDTLMG